MHYGNIFKSLFIALGFLVTGQFVNAQIFEIQTPGVTGVPAGMQPGDYFDIDFRIKTNNNQPYSGQIEVRVAVNGTTLSLNPNHIDIAQNGNGNTFDISVDSIEVLFPPFMLGHNGVVVWVVDDNFTPISDQGSVGTVVSAVPALALTEEGPVDFPMNPIFEKTYQFRFSVTNVHKETFNDRVQLHLYGAGQEFVIQSDPVSIPPNSAVEVDFPGFIYNNPPFENGFNPIDIWANSDDAISLDTLDRDLDIRSSTSVGRPQPSNPAVVGFRNPTDGPLIIRTKPGTIVKSVSLHDLSGRMVFAHAGIDAIDLAADTQLEDGMYWMSAQLSDGSRLLAKLLFVR